MIGSLHPGEVSRCRDSLIGCWMLWIGDVFDGDFMSELELRGCPQVGE